MTSAHDPGSTPAAFDRYAAWYDAFNRGKDYAGEVRYLLRRVRTWRPVPRTWLDVGCGTGHHAGVLQLLGVSVEGVDRSEAMIARARLIHPAITFHVGNAQDFRLPGSRDVISMLFHAMSYQVSDHQVRDGLQNLGAHLSPDGLLLFDFWHSEAVVRDPPGPRVRQAIVDGRPLWRLTRSVEDRPRRLIDVRFEFRWDSPTGPLAHEESHAMRHFDVAELTTFLEDAGLSVMACDAWLEDRPLGPRDWYGFICARKAAASSSEPNRAGR